LSIVLAAIFLFAFLALIVFFSVALMTVLLVD